MTATAAEPFTIRVHVLDAWDQLTLAVTAETTVGEVKRRALSDALGGRPVDPDAYEVKLRGGLVTDEGVTLDVLGVHANVALIVLPRRRRPAW